MATIAIVDGLDLAAIRLYLAVIELGSVSQAAARLQITQPSATARLQKLERQLGTTLLERTTTGSVPTADGTRIAPACAELLASATSLVDRAEALRSQAERLTIASTRHVGDHFLPAWIEAIDLSDVALELVEHDTLGVARAVRSGEATLGFTEGPHPPLGLRSRIVARERLVPVVGRTHAWFGRRRVVTAGDLVTTTLILPAAGSGARDVLEASFAEHELGGVGDTVDVRNASEARLAALNGAGVAFLPDCWAHGQLASGSLFALPVREPTVEQPVRLVWRGARPAPMAARRLVDAIPEVG